MSTLDPPQTTKGYLVALLATAAWSSTAVFIRYLTETNRMPPLALAFWRDLIVSLVLGIGLLIYRPNLLHLTRSTLRFFILFGIVLALFNSAWTISVAYNGAAVSTVLAYSSAAITALLGWKFMNEGLDPAKIGAVAFSILGCALVSGAYDPTAWQLNAVGITIGILSGLAFALYSLMGRRASENAIHPLVTLFYSFAFGSVFLLFINLAASPGLTKVGEQLLWLQNDWKAWAILIILAIGPTIGGYGLYIASLVYLPASTANLIATLEPGLTALLAFFFLGERLTIPQLGGSALILGGLIFLRWSEYKTTALPVPEQATP